jgi:hypothetical protein
MGLDPDILYYTASFVSGYRYILCIFGCVYLLVLYLAVALSMYGYGLMVSAVLGYWL